MRLATILTSVCLLAAFPPLAMADVYRCEVRDQVSRQNDGTVGRSDMDETYVNSRWVIVADTSTGAVRMETGTAGPYVRTWEIVQRGSDAHSWIMLWRYDGGASVALQTIHIRTWQQPVTFVWADITFSTMAPGFAHLSDKAVVAGQAPPRVAGRGLPSGPERREGQRRPAARNAASAHSQGRQASSGGAAPKARTSLVGSSPGRSPRR